MYKVVVIGDAAVGKTNLITRCTGQEFSHAYKTTIGVDFSHVDVETGDGQTTCLQMWDTAGQERFRSIARCYFRGAAAAVIVYDVTSAQSFRSVTKWLQEATEYSPGLKCVMLIGNKIDLSASRVISTVDALRFARQHNLMFTETSALDGTMNNWFQDLANELIVTKTPPLTVSSFTPTPQPDLPGTVRKKRDCAC